ncbi:MAG: nitrate reductase cytochrome c-type subunit [Hyphomicrobiales bacterium]|nr:nitrate reductase cytochrome c-type subunit [Hyphomicrobiales bacterium]
MKRIAIIALAGLVAAAFAASAGADSVTSLRGATDIPAANPAPAEHEPKTVRGKFERTFKEQPPLVAHTIDDARKYKINLRQNGCLDCHDKANYEEEKAPMVSKTHYIGADGKEKEEINKGRYFCTQCHVPQMQAEPLVNNTFVGNVGTK